MAGRPPKRIDQQELATILSFGDLHGDKAAAERFGVSLRTIQRRRAALRNGDDAQLAALVIEAKGRGLERCADLLTATYEVALRRLDQLIPEASFDETLSAVRVVGDLHLARAALTGDDDEDDFGSGRKNPAAQGGSSATTH